MRPAVEVLEDKTVGWTAAPPHAGSTLKDGLTLSFEPASRHGMAGVEVMLRVIPCQELQARFPKSMELLVPLAISRTKLAGAVAECQRVWWSEVVDRSNILRTFYFYHEVSDRPVSESVFSSKVLPSLAKAGSALFGAVFRPGERKFSATKELGGVLRDLLVQEKDLRILIKSDEFFAPWNFMYVGDWHAPTVDHFLGFRHLVEHDVEDSPPFEAAMPPFSELAFHFNEDIDLNPKTGVHFAGKKFLEMLQQFGIERKRRDDKQTFLAALENGADESVFYFLCHGTSGDDTRPNSDTTRLFLTQPAGVDNEVISPSDILLAFDNRCPLRGQPLVFINACRALKSGSIYFDGFATHFLNNDARCVLGPDIEMPVVFARDFANRFFEDFFRAGPKMSVGRVLLDMRRDFLSNGLNPLGLAYSLYRGSNVYLSAVPIPRSVAASAPTS